jgi:hypothetical protein
MSELAVELDNLVRVDTLLAQQDEIQLRLEADIGLSEAIDLAIDAASSRDAGVAKLHSTIEMARYIAKLAGAADEDLRAVAAIPSEEYGGAAPSAATTEDMLDRLDRLAIKREIARLGVLDVEVFRANVSDEVTRPGASRTRWRSTSSRTRRRSRRRTSCDCFRRSAKSL